MVSFADYRSPRGRRLDVYLRLNRDSERGLRRWLNLRRGGRGWLGVQALCYKLLWSYQCLLYRCTELVKLLYLISYYSHRGGYRREY